MTIPADYHEGEPITYVPIVKHPRDFMFCFGPVGFEKVETVVKCPLCIDPPPPVQGKRRSRAGYSSVIRPNSMKRWS